MVTLNCENGCAAGVPDQGSIELSVRYVPQAVIAKRRLVAAEELQLEFFERQLRRLLERRDELARLSSSASTLPASFTRTPSSLFSATTYRASNDPNGLASCAAW